MSQSDGPGRMPRWEEVRAFATHAEAIGIDSLWVCDHLISGPPGQPPEGIHEGWTILSALAASTSRVELGQLVMCSSFRNPGLLAKMAVTADTISGNRLILGLGAGWYDPEYDAFGYPTDHRVSRLEQALRIITPLLRLLHNASERGFSTSCAVAVARVAPFRPAESGRAARRATCVRRPVLPPSPFLPGRGRRATI